MIDCNSLPNSASVNCTSNPVVHAAAAHSSSSMLESSYNHTFVIITGIVAGAVVLSLLVTILAVTWIRQKRYREQMQNYTSSGRKTTSVSIQNLREENGLGKPPSPPPLAAEEEQVAKSPAFSQETASSSSPPSFGRRLSPPPRVPAVKIAPAVPNPVPKRKLSKNLGLEVPTISTAGRQRTLSAVRRDGKLNSPSSELYGMK